MRVALVAIALLLGCGPNEEEAPPEATSVAPAPAAEPAEEDELLDELDEEEPLPALGEEALDAMDQPALEAACFGGSTAACDRLGH